MTHDRPVLGIILMLGFCLLAPIGDATAKLLGETLPLGQIVWVRFAIQAAILVPIVWVTGRGWRMRSLVFRLTCLRTVMHILGIGAMFTALQYLPLADAIAIAFVMPFFQLLLGKYILAEEVGARRLWACIVGFIGTLFVVQPSFAAVGWPALLPIFVAINFSLFMLITRQMAKEIDPIGLQAVSGVIAIVIMAPLLWLSVGSGVAALQIVMPTGVETTLLLVIGVVGTLAHLLMTWSLRYAPSATVAPMQYLEIPFATVIGYLVFQDLPNTLASIGIVITISAGLYILLREQAIARQAKIAPAE